MEEEIRISPELSKFLVIYQLTVDELLLIEDHILLEMDGFGYRMLLEVLKLRDS